MNPFLDEMVDELFHYGMPRRSGRYPYGSGKDPYQHNGDFMARVEELRGQNFSFTDEDGKTWTGDNAIAKSMGLTTTQFRTRYSLAKDERRSLEVARAKSLRADGYSLNEIASMMGYENDSSIRSLLNGDSEARMNQAKVTADYLKKCVDEKGMIDVGSGVERYLDVSKEKLSQALYMLELEGYEVYGGGVPQATNPGQQTNLKVLCPPGTQHKEIYNYENVHSIRDFGNVIGEDADGIDIVRKAFVYPESLDSSRLQIRYAEEGGIDKDGVIELRRGVQDLSLGDSHYAQVRIMVDGTHYLKGMAVYSDDLPDGVDVLFNTNKKQGTAMKDVLKKIKDDPDNPFGSLIKEEGGQSYYIDEKDGKQKLSLINKRADEGDWGEWSDHLPSQFLSKQNLSLADRQLKLAEADKQAEFDEICSLTNPTIKRAMLKSFADDCDSSAVHLQAAALPRQKYQVILPLTTIGENEIYAPNYKDGETVALIRYPHGGTFEIPILKVNNKLPEGKSVLGTSPKDAVGISAKVAERLSGADFDGDTVMVIPTGGKTKITSTPPLEGLKGFDPKMEYGYSKKTVDANGNEHYYRGDREFKIMKNTQTEMGVVSNLITDMTIKGASSSELAAAVRHSMVVIDAEKHKLDYRQSYEDNNIGYLKKKYQGRIDPETGKYREGASTLISKAKSETQVLKRKGSPIIDPETGEQSYKEVTETYIDKNGKTKVRTQKSTKMAEARDARSLISDLNSDMENRYADYANKMKSLANQARKELISTGRLKYDPQAKKVYQKEVDSLGSKLRIALLNAPKERQAQLLANSIIKAKKQEYDMTKAELKKESQRALTQARIKTGAKRYNIEITDREWEAIQAGAISDNVLSQIIDHSDSTKLRERATPRATTQLSDAKINKMKQMKNSGYTADEIAQAIGCSASTVHKYT